MRGLPREFAALLVLLAAMVALMWRPMRDEVATQDEPVFLAAGYTYLKGMGLHIDPEQPPLAKKWSALPWLFMDVKISERAGAYLNPNWGYPETRTWADEDVPLQTISPLGRDSWYFRPLAEGYAFGNLLLYDGTNDAEKLLFAGRLMQVALTLLTATVIFLWIRQLAGGEAAVFGTALWAFNPIVLSYGHLVLTDMGVTLMFLLGVWSFSNLLKQPTSWRAVLVGLATGGALLMKFTAVLLVPIYGAMTAVWWLKTPGERRQLGSVWKVFLLVGVVTWGTILLGYEPFWSPAPPLPVDLAARMGVPWWFRDFRLCLIPPDFFKGLACQIGHSRAGHLAYLCGEWRQTGWWYYYLVALALKTPIPWLILLLIGSFLAFKTVGRGPALLGAPWIAAIVYLGFAMSSSINIGVRHLLPMIALLTVGIATMIALQSKRVQGGAWLLCGWLVVTALFAYPGYLKYFNEFAGGKRNGYRYLLDSNLDWGQDVKSLKKYLEVYHIDHIYQYYCGYDVILKYYGISNTRVFPDQARQLQQGILVISVHDVMGRSWNWLRESRRPLACVADTFFVYDLTPIAATP